MSAAEQPGLLELVKRRPAVTVRLHVHVEHVGARVAGGDSDVPVRHCGPPRADPPLVGRGVLEAVRCVRLFAVGLTRMDWPPGRRVRERGAERCGQDDRLLSVYRGSADVVPVQAPPLAGRCSALSGGI